MNFLRALSPRTEFVIVSALALSYFLAGAVFVFVSGTRSAEMSAERAGRAILIELLVLATGFAILRARGWDAERLGIRFTWQGALAGVPLTLLYLLLYSIAATLVLLVWPGAREAAFRHVITAPFWLMLLYVVVTAFLQEVAVTAYVISSLAARGAAVAIGVSTLLRLACFAYQGPLIAIAIIPVGLIFGALFWQWRTVWPQIVAHSLANVVALASNAGTGG